MKIASGRLRIADGWPFTRALGHLLWAAAAASGAGYHLVENFTAPLPGRGTVTAEVDRENARVGLAAARLAYGLTPKAQQAGLQFPTEAIRIPGPGQLKLWVRPDGSGDEMQLTVCHAESFLDDRGERRLKDHARLALPRVKLDFAEWREVAFDLRGVPAGRAVWLERIEFHGRRKEGERPEAAVMVDDLRLVPVAGEPPATMATRLMGPPARDFATSVAVALDVRSFVAAPARARVRLTMTDRNGNAVADRDFDVPLAAGQSSETKLELAPEKLDAYLPPFTLTCDVVSSDLPQLSQKSEHNLVMANSVFLFDDMSDALGRWFTAGYPGDLRQNPRSWVSWTHGEAQRASPWTQTSAAISRVRVPDDERPATPPAPFGMFALRVDYSGDAVVYCGRERYLPGNAFRLGAWVHGDGSGAKLYALFLDYTDSADFWEGGWKRLYDGERELCALDFTGWRYVEVPLPGDGLGSNAPRGSTAELDFPLELTAFRIEPPRGKEAAAPPSHGTVLIGSLIVHTQQEASGTLALHVGADDPERWFDPAHGAWAAVQNASPVRARKVRAAWALLDRANEAIGKGQADLDLAPREARTLRLDLAKAAPDAARRQGPLRLQIVASDAADAGVSATRELILAKPDSTVALAGFESDRGCLGLKAHSLDTAPPAGEAAARTSTEQARGGRRSLALAWDKAKTPPQRPGLPPPRLLVVASVDPALPGVPVELSLWLHGDGSGALFYPLVGDTRGVSHGGHGRDFDLFLARAAGESALQDAVRVDWQGWRKLEFRLPAIPPSWDKPQPVLGFAPSYPLGLHLAVDPQGADRDRGTLFVDDIVVRTHLAPAERLTLAWDRADESNVVPPGGAVQATVANGDAVARSATLSGGVFDWRGRRVAGLDEKLTLEPGEAKSVVAAKGLPVGAYALRLRLAEGDVVLASVEEDMLVADLRHALGDGWLAALRDEWKLRAPVGDRYEFVDEDWDWVEHYPGNVQLDSLRERARRVAAAGGEPHVLLGYSAYWAAGIGLEQLKADALERRLRDAGHAVDTFLVPERIEDWDHYVCEVMRGAGREVGGFVLWNGPDAGALAVEPERLARMMASADAWRRRYCPKTPLLIGGMSRAAAVPYLAKLGELGALDHVTGVNVRLDVGRLSPEDAQVPAYVRELGDALAKGSREPKSILLTDLDWAVERSDHGPAAAETAAGRIGAFEQAAYLTRSDLLLHAAGIRPALAICNDDFARLGLGLTYRRELLVPPLAERPATLQLKPAWWGVLRARQWLEQTQAAEPIEVQDVVPARTRCLAARRRDGKVVAIVWRNDDPGAVTFAQAGLAIEAAEDVFGSPVPAEGGWHAVGKVPVAFVLGESDWSRARDALVRLWVRDGAEPAWPQRLLAVVRPEANDATQRFSVAVPQGAGLVLRQRFVLEGDGCRCEVAVNGKAIGTWDLRRSAPELSLGPRECIFVIPPEAVAGGAKAEIELRCDPAMPASQWRVFEYRGGDFPLSAVGAIHIEQNVAQPRLGRNIVGGPLAVGQTSFANGIGTFANSLLEYPLNRQFTRFTAKVGVDAVTEGKGSVVFEVHGDGRKLWASPVMSGLDAARDVELDVTGVNRLRLVATDAGDGNKSDAANWCEPVLHR
mgnify:CR=1 FL=1